MTTLIDKDTSEVYLSQSGEFERLADRTRSFKTFHGRDRVVRIAGQLGPIHYKLDPFDETEKYKEIDLNILPTPSKDWDAACETNGYQVRIWDKQLIDDKEVRCVAQFRRAAQWLTVAPYALVWENDMGERQLVSNCTPSTTFDIDNDNYRVVWKDAFGKGIDYRYNLRPDEFFKTVVINDKVSLPAPTIDSAGLKLTVILGMAWSEDSQLANGFGVDINPSVLPADVPDKVVDEEFIDSNLFSCKDTFLRDVFWLQKPKVWDSASTPNVVELNWRLQREADKVFAFLDLPSTYLEDLTTVYPVYFDVDISEELVGASSDDARRVIGGWEEWSTITPEFSAGSPTIFEYNIRSGVRYTTLPIPVAANIVSATLKLYARSSSGGTFGSWVSGNDVDDAATFSTAVDFDGRVVTTTHVGWVVGDWTNNTWYTSTDLLNLIQEIVDRPGWAHNNSIALFWEYQLVGQPLGSGDTQSADSYDASPATAPRFNLSYTPSGSGPTTIDAGTDWEVRDTGAADNGAGFADLDPGTSVDYSQQDAAQLTLTDLAMTTGTTTLTSAVGGFTAAMVGNIIFISTGAGSGTNFVSDYYQVTGFNNSNSVEIDRDATDGSNASGGAGKLGGALDGLVEFFLETLHAGNTVWIRYGEYEQYAGIEASNGGTSTAYIKIYGYYNTRGDTPRGNKRPFIDVDGEWFNLGNYAGGFWDVRNIRFAYPDAFGIGMGGPDSLFMNCKSVVWGNPGFEIWRPGGRIIDCQVLREGGSFSKGFDIDTGSNDGGAIGSIADGCYIEGMRWGVETHVDSVFLFDCIFYYCTENHIGRYNYVKNCTIHGGDYLTNTDGIGVIDSQGPPYAPVTVINCIFNDCSVGFGGSTVVRHYLDYCIFWSNLMDVGHNEPESIKGVHSSNKNPRYVNASYVVDDPAADFRLLAGSTVLNTGMTLHEGSIE